MTVDFCHSFILRELAKNGQQGYVSPNDFNDNINMAQYAFMDYLLGQFQQYQVGRPVARVDYSMNEKARQRLTPFIKEFVPITIDSTGLAPYPSDFQQVDSMNTTALDRVRYAPQHKLYSYIKSKIDPIATNPIWTIEDDGFRFYPNLTDNPTLPNITSARLSYVGTPPNIVWNYNPDPTTGLPVYTSIGSVDPEWYDVDMGEILARTLKYFGVEMEAAAVLQYANQIVQQGQ